MKTTNKKPQTRLGRRDVLKGAAVLVAPFAALPLAPALILTSGGCSPSEDPPPARLFKHGVASGDPLADGVILWTRITTDAPVDVTWEVAEDPAMMKRVANGTFHTDAERDYTVKVDVRGLMPGRTYYYQFHALDDVSMVARTRTLPSGPTERLRLALVSCASFAHGYFHGYQAVAGQADLDAVIHLGDYVYEYGSLEYGDVRPYEPEHECLTLADYRMRHSLYKRDQDVQAVHRQHVFITIWDDHEVANDGYDLGAENHTEGSEGAWLDRKAAALRVYKEWMPIREQPDGRIFRKLSFGDLADLTLLDTRYWKRTKQAGGILGAPPAPDPTRTLLGDDQAAWMENELKTSKATWQLLGQQVMVGNLILETGKQLANLDQWHGYPESRKRLLDFFKTSGVKNVVVLTGDIHSSWANEIVNNPTDTVEYDPATGRGSLAVEIVTPGISSPGVPALFLGLVDKARPLNPHIRWMELTKRGFVILDVTHARVQGAWYHFEDITVPERQTPAFANAWSVKAGETRLVMDSGAAPDREGGAPLLSDF